MPTNSPCSSCRWTASACWGDTASPLRPCRDDPLGMTRDMTLDRRTLIVQLAAAMLAPRAARAGTVTDGAGRSVPVPARVERVFPAGPPAAIFLYTLAPELLLG